MIPRKVIFFSSYAPSLATVRGDLIRDAVGRGHSVLAAAPDFDPATAGALRGLGAELLEVPLTNTSTNPLDLLRALWTFRRTLRRHRPDVLFSYTIKPVIVAALAGSAERVPRIVSLMTGLGYAFTGGREPTRIVSRAAASSLYRRALAKSDVALFENPDDEREFRNRKLLPPGTPSAVVNGCGIDLELFAPTPLPAGTAFLMIARLLKDKGIREFAAAAKRIKAEHPEVPIALVGYLDSSPDALTKSELDELIARGVDFKGRLEDVRPAIAECSVYVLPSYREGLPRSILEAMAMGRAIVTTDAPGCRQTVEDGENGVLVPPRDSEALYEAMMRFVRDPSLARRMGEASRRLAEMKFDVREVNRTILELAGL